MLIYKRFHDMIIIVLLIGLINLYDIIKNIDITILDVIYINENNIIYFIFISFFFFFIFFQSKLSPQVSMEFELILGLGFIGLFFLLISNDLVLFYLALELYSISIYLLLYKNKINKAKISILYFLIGSISSSLILLGFSILYNQTGSLNINYIIENLNCILLYHQDSQWIIGFAFALFFIGLLFKIGAAPFQFLVIRIYSQMDLSILLYQAIIPKIAYLFIIFNLFYKIDNYFILLLILSSAFFSLFIGPIGGITHGVHNFKTIIAYSSILHVGFLLLGIVAYSFSTAIYLNIFQYLLIYGINTFQFLLALFFYQKNKNKKIIKIFLIISIFSFIGLPPFAGFYAKINILLNCYLTNNFIFQIIAILFIILSTLIAIYLYLKFINFFFLKDIDKDRDSSFDFSINFSLSYFFSFLSLFLIFYPFLFPYFSPLFEILSF